MTIRQDKLTTFAASFEHKARDNGDGFFALKDDAPEWVSEIVREAHQGELPDDWHYEIAYRFALYASDYDGDPEDYTHEITDSLVDIGYHQLALWLAHAANAREYCEEAREEFGWAEEGDMASAIQRGQYLAISRIGAIVLEGCKGLDDILNEGDEAIDRAVYNAIYRNTRGKQ